MDNRANILQCALDLWAARGYDAVGVQEISEAAGITKPTLYHYFGSKQGLLQSLLAGQFEAFLAVLRPAAEYHGDLPLTLDRLAMACFDFARAHAAFSRLQLALRYAPPDSEAALTVAPHAQELQALFEDLFARAVREHGNMRGRQRAYAATFQGVVNTYIGLWLHSQGTLDDDLARQAVKQFQHGIYS
jgi:AcrR family transcriptional regulator